MKYVAVAVIFLALGYVIAQYLPPSSFTGEAAAGEPDLAAAESAATTVDTDAAAGEQSLADSEYTIGDIAPPSPSDLDLSAIPVPVQAGAPNPKTAPSKPYEEGSYLTELDLLSSTESIKPLGFRVGPPIKANKADGLIERVTPSLPAVKAQYLTPNNQPAVIVIAGTYEDFDTANKARAALQPNIRERLEIIYLPECIQAGSPNSEGFLCAPEKTPEEVSADASAT